jgi:hypothetical protein
MSEHAIELPARLLGDLAEWTRLARERLEGIDDVHDGAAIVSFIDDDIARQHHAGVDLCRKSLMG